MSGISVEPFHQCNKLTLPTLLDLDIQRLRSRPSVNVGTEAGSKLARDQGVYCGIVTTRAT